MLLFIIAECRAKVWVMAHRRLISSPHNHTSISTHTNTHVPHVPFGLPCHYPRTDVTHAIKPLYCPVPSEEFLASRFSTVFPPCYSV